MASSHPFHLTYRYLGPHEWKNQNVPLLTSPILQWRTRIRFSQDLSIGPMIHRADHLPPHGKDVLRVRYAAAIDRHIPQASSAVYACLCNKLDKLLCRLGHS
jgi:hypothetical protein